MLDAAAFGGANKVVDVLLKNNADPNMIGKNGTSALEDAALKGFDPIVVMLLDHGALINQVNPASGTTALYSSAAFGKEDTVKMLLKRGANPNLCGKSHSTSYAVALENGFNEAAAEIERQGGSKNCGQ